MSIKGFIVNGSTQKYDYNELDNKPTIPSGGGVSDDLKTALLQLAQKVAYIDANGSTCYQDLYDALYGSTPTPTIYTVTNTLTHVTNSNNASTATSGSSYSGTLSAASGYTITTVTITMGGVNITSTAYSNGTVSIASVSGNIVITASATEQQATLSSITATFTQGSAVIYDTDTLDSLKQYLVVTANWSDSTTSTVPASSYTLSGTLTVGTSTITATYSGKSDTFIVTVTEEQQDTKPVITDYNMRLSNNGTTTAQTGMCVTDFYELNDSGVTIYTYYTEAEEPYSVANLLVYNSSKQVQEHWNAKPSSPPNPKAIDFSAYGTFPYVRFTLFTSGLDDCYCYETNTGKILFAGEDSPYYNMSNISEATT